MKDDNEIELISAEEFFGEIPENNDISLPDAKAKGRVSVAESDFQDQKVKMIMKLEHCSREDALATIRERAEERAARKNHSN